MRMFGQRPQPEEPHGLARVFRRRRPERSNIGAKLAWVFLIGGVGLVAARATVATVVQVHGDGMAPTIFDGDNVLLTRSRWDLEAGDIVIYDPARTSPAVPLDTPPEGSPEGIVETDPNYTDPSLSPRGELRNTAVVDLDEIEGRWERLRDKGKPKRERSEVLRVGRVVAVPGDVVTFNVPEAAHGVAVNGEPLQQKPGEPMRLVLEHESEPRLRATAYEWIGSMRYPVLVPVSEDPGWPGMELPEDLGPIEVEATGYLVLADNREEGACCDSRALGFVERSAIKGEVRARVSGDAHSSPDAAPESRGPRWLP